jgi:hypothetical protein
MRTATLYSEDLTAMSCPGLVMLQMSFCSVVGHQYMWDIAGVASKERLQYSTYIALLNQVVTDRLPVACSPCRLQQNHSFSILKVVNQHITRF